MSPHPQPPSFTSHPLQRAPQHPLPTAISQLIPNLQPPDPNNFYDQLRYFEGMPMNSSSFSTHRIIGATKFLFQSLTSQNNPGLLPQHANPSKPQQPVPGPSDQRTKKKTSLSPVQSYRHSRPKPIGLSLIPKPGRDDTRPLDLQMNLDGRHRTYIKIRVC